MRLHLDDLGQLDASTEEVVNELWHVMEKSCKLQMVCAYSYASSILVLALLHTLGDRFSLDVFREEG